MGLAALIFLFVSQTLLQEIWLDSWRPRSLWVSAVGEWSAVRRRQEKSPQPRPRGQQCCQVMSVLVYFQRTSWGAWGWDVVSLDSLPSVSWKNDVVCCSIINNSQVAGHLCVAVYSWRTGRNGVLGRHAFCVQAIGSFLSQPPVLGTHCWAKSHQFLPFWSLTSSS